MQDANFRRNPKVIFKAIRGRVGVLNTETTELFILDELASNVLMHLMQGADGAMVDSHFSESKAIIAYLLEAKILIASS